MEWLEVVKDMGDAPFKGIVVLLFLYAVRELSKMRRSVETLNLGIAVMGEKVKGHDGRIRVLERKRK